MKPHTRHALLLPALVLAACSQSFDPVLPVNGDIPFVPVSTRPAQPRCGASGQGAARLVGLANLAGENRIEVGGLRAQSLPDTLQSLLYITRVLVNGHYYGFSTVDLQAVHEQWTATFKATRPLSLALYPIDEGVDATMTDYLNAFRDGHTYYLNLASAQSYRATRDGTATPAPVFGGLVKALPDADGAILASVRGDGPFAAAGLRRGDVLLSVNGVSFRRVDAGGGADAALTNRRAYSKLLADAAQTKAPVTFGYSRAGQVGTVSVQAQLLSAVQLPSGGLIAGTTHYLLRLPSFQGAGVASRVHALVADAQARGATDIIIDLRDNGGGLVSQFVGAAGAFSPGTSGEVLEDLSANDISFRYGSGQIVATDACGDPPYRETIAAPALWTGQTVILTNSGSASAAELFTQALRLGGRAQVIGEPTYGVGNTFTYIFDTPGARDISVTAGRGRLLNGQYAQERVMPDELMPDDLTALAAGHDRALAAALADLAR